MNAKKTAAALLIIQGEMKKDIAEKLGVRRETLSRWQRDEDFKTFISDQLREITASANKKVCSMTHTALETLRELMSNEEPPAVRYQSAAKIMDIAQKVQNEVEDDTPKWLKIKVDI